MISKTILPVLYMYICRLFWIQETVRHPSSTSPTPPPCLSMPPSWVRIWLCPLSPTGQKPVLQDGHLSVSAGSRVVTWLDPFKALHVLVLHERSSTVYCFQMALMEKLYWVCWIIPGCSPTPFPATLGNEVR